MHSPRFMQPSLSTRSGGLRLYVPGSLMEQRFTFPCTIALYTSRNNPGAAEVAREMQVSFPDDVHVTSIVPLGDGSKRNSASARWSRQRAIVTVPAQCAAAPAPVQRANSKRLLVRSLSRNWNEICARETELPATHFLLCIAIAT